MAYVPPHKRHGEPCKPATMGKSSLKPVIRRARDSTKRLWVVSDRSLVRFELFPGESYVHLSDRKLYTVVGAEEDTPGSDKALADAFSESLALTDRSLYGVIPRISSDLSAALERLEENRPKLVVRFGRVLFSSDRNLDARNVSVDSLVNGFSNDMVFEAGISSELFNKLREIASSMQEQIQVTQKHRYNFLVRDRKRSHNHRVKCCCSPAEDNKSIVLKKVKSQPLRHMVSDVLCVGKMLDLRVFLYTEERYADLPEVETNGLKAIANAAVIDDQLKGGLKWPPGENLFMNRWSVEEVDFRDVTILTAGNARWTFTVANRSTRLTHEVKVSHLDFKACEATSQLDMLLDLAKKCIDKV